jgi:hypothetical protein
MKKGKENGREGKKETVEVEESIEEGKGYQAKCDMWSFFE